MLGCIVIMVANVFVETMDVDQQTFIVGRNKLEPGQTLSPDLSTYEMLHALSTPWPCLSFDLINDSLGDNRKTYPASTVLSPRQPKRHHQPQKPRDVMSGATRT